MNNIKMHNVRTLKNLKSKRIIHMLTCYDYPTAQMLNQTELDMILVGDSLGNVVLGYENTLAVTLEEMIIFSRAVKRGAPDKFTIADMPFGTYAHISLGVANAIKLIQKTGVQAVKLEGAQATQLKIIEKLTSHGVAVMGHLGLQPQSVHGQGGYFTHGKTDDEKKTIMKQAKQLESAGVFSIVLECVEKSLATQITQSLNVPTIGIGSGLQTDGQVLVINDLLGLNYSQPPSFCKPVANLIKEKKKLVDYYLSQL